VFLFVRGFASSRERDRQTLISLLFKQKQVKTKLAHVLIINPNTFSCGKGALKGEAVEMSTKYACYLQQ
jgi:hypothetical protein